MKKYLVCVVLGTLLMGCGSAADTLRGDPWKVEKWTYSIDSIFDGSGNMKPSSSTSTASADNAGTLTFTEGTEVAIGGGGRLARSFTQVANRGTNEARFVMGTLNDSLGWDPGGTKGEDDMVTIYTGSDPSWNGAWILTGGGNDVTLTHAFQTDFSPTQHMIERHTLHLTR